MAVHVPRDFGVEPDADRIEKVFTPDDANVEVADPPSRQAINGSRRAPADRAGDLGVVIASASGTTPIGGSSATRRRQHSVGGFVHGAVAAQHQYPAAPCRTASRTSSVPDQGPWFPPPPPRPTPRAPRPGDLIREARSPPVARGRVDEEQRAQAKGVLSLTKWRERVGIEPTGATEGVSVAVLKTGQATRPDPPPMLDN